MKPTPPAEPASDRNGLAADVRRRLIQVLAILLILSALLFLSAGRLDWWLAWTYLGIYLGLIVANAWTLLRKDPGLIAERGKVKPGTKSWDKVLANSTLFGTAGSMLVAGLDVRNGWTTGLNLAVPLGAMTLSAVGYAIIYWAMTSNRFFAGVVRIQTERGHTVATGGPYRFVRHPGYVGMILVTLLTGPALGSLWALIPGCIGSCGSIVRTALEDATLQAELPGYREYTRRVRYRLIPGLW